MTEESYSEIIRRLASHGWTRPAIRAWFANRGTPISRNLISYALQGTNYPASESVRGRPREWPTCPHCGQTYRP